MLFIGKPKGRSMMISNTLLQQAPSSVIGIITVGPFRSPEPVNLLSLCRGYCCPVVQLDCSALCFNKLNKPLGILLKISKKLLTLGVKTVHISGPPVAALGIVAL